MRTSVKFPATAGGAHHLVPGARTVIDIGGHDCKVIALDERGGLKDFLMSKKCAAGTGRSLEQMARSLGLDVTEIGSVALEAADPVLLKSECSVFADLEIRHCLLYGREVPDVAAGIVRLFARRVKVMARRLGLCEELCLTGGVSKNVGMVQYLERMLGMKPVELPEDPQIVGALGAAVIAAERIEGRSPAIRSRSA